MKYFIDTEFIEREQTIDLLSIGIVAEDDRRLYLCNRDAKLDRADEWLIWNVYPHLPVKHGADGWYWDAPSRQTGDPWPSNAVVVPSAIIRDRVLEFIWIDPAIEIVLYYGAYDWVVFCWLFGRMVDLPKGFPKHYTDVKQMANQLGNRRLPPQDTPKHHALNDAEWTKKAFEFLQAINNFKVEERKVAP